MVVAMCVAGSATAQTDSLSMTTQSIEVRGTIAQEAGAMPTVDGVRIYGGKKSWFIAPANSSMDLSSNASRQLFAKVPGISIWESDGSGIQTGIATRGLSPNRSWEFNMRQNGYDIASDVFGYPEAYYTPPADAVARIEILRGASSLQYGPQFGGMINYVFDEAPEKNGSAVKFRQAGGSYGLFNSFVSAGYRQNKWTFYSFYHRRSAEGWRANSSYLTNTAFVRMGYDITKNFRAKWEFTHSNMLSQQPGGLTDAQFLSDPRQSSRARNWMNVPWNVMQMQIDWQLATHLQLELKVFGLLAKRSSVGFLDPITTVDQGLSRRVDSDEYRNWGTEGRLRFDYLVFGKKQSLAAGLRAYQAKTLRQQRGTGTSGSDFDMTADSLGYKVNYSFGTLNYAAFAEQVFYVGKRLMVVPGVRYEWIQTTGTGSLNYQNEHLPHQSKQIGSLLTGIGSEYQLAKSQTAYANVSQGFRPMTFSELVPSATTDVIDPNLTNSTSINADAGMRGRWKNRLTYDIGVYQMNIANRIGSYVLNGVKYVTNIGSSRSRGVELFVEGKFLNQFRQGKFGELEVFASVAYNESVYTSWNDPTVLSGSSSDRSNKQVENAPKRIARYGVTYTYHAIRAHVQWNQVSASYADALNTEVTNAAATVGLIPAYQVGDVSLTYQSKGGWRIQAGVNNVLNEHYFTRRATGYPGPGLMPANGRTYVLTVGFDFAKATI